MRRHFIARHIVEAGGMIGYGSNVIERYRRVAYFVDRILKGGKPADIPFTGGARVPVRVGVQRPDNEIVEAVVLGRNGRPAACQLCQVIDQAQFLSGPRSRFLPTRQSQLLRCITGCSHEGKRC
jgi:hypothetical protein